MARLNQLFEYLFTNAGSVLALDSGTTGVFQQEGAPPFPVFRAPLSSGQILLLFTDVVPSTLSTQLLSGVPVEFHHETPQGVVSVHMTLSGDDLRVTARAVKKAPLTLVPLTGKHLGPLPPDLAASARPALAAMLAEMEPRRATHLHLSAGGPALLRVDGALLPLEGPAFSERELRQELEQLAPDALRDEVRRHLRFDFTHVSRTGVFHLSAQQARAGLSLVVRHLPRGVPSISALGVPSELAHAMAGAGLWVLCGPPGHGVTTTLASVVQAAITQRAVSARTVEAPIEYVLSPGQGPLCQLEVGSHVQSFAEALVDARRDDVDLVMVSELDDAEVLREALALTERGKLVVGTLHAHGATQAAEKLVHLTAGHPLARFQLSQVLRGIFAQVLCRNTAGGRSLAWELLPGVSPVRAALGQGHVAALPPLRTRTLEQSLGELVSASLVGPDEALAAAPDRSALDALLSHAPDTSRNAA